MKRKLLLFLVAMLPMLTYAYDAYIGGIYYNFSGNNATVTYKDNYNSYSGKVVIPASVTYNSKTYSVTSIGEYAFFNCQGLTSVTIPNSVTAIGDYAFFYCWKLNSCTIPNSVTSIGDGAFGDCISLTSIKVAEGNTKYDSRDNCNAIIETATNTLVVGCKSSFIPNSVTSIGDYAFYYCTHLTSLTIPNSVTSIGDYAFYYCTHLTSLTIPNSVTSIGDCAFSVCSSLTSISIPNSVTSIGEWTFFGSGLTSITIPEGVTNIGEYTFYECSSLTSITIPNSVTSIGNAAFRECSGLSSIIIPNSVTSIGSYAFCDCSSLTSITIGSGVTSIGDNAFRECRSLKSVTIPNNVTSIGNYAFDGCSSLTIVKVKKTTPVTISSSTFSNRANATLYIPTGSLSAYRTAEYWKEFKEIKEDIPEENGIYYNLDKEKMVAEVRAMPNNEKYSGDIVIPSSITFNDKTYSVTSIAKQAFEGCSRLTSVSVPEGVTSIGNGAFSGCNNLTSVTLESNTIVSASRTSSTSMKSIFGEQVKTYILGTFISVIGKNAFYGCSGLTSVTIPNSVTCIGDYAFSGCRGLTSITTPEGLTNIGNYAFQSCTSLTSITIPNSVTSIGSSVFYGCSSLTSISIPNSVTSIGSYAFSGCRGLTSITIPEGVTNIGEYTFYGCSSLTSVTIPESVTSIEEHAFSGCTSLTLVTIPNSVTSIGEWTFSGSGLTSVTIPNSVTSIGNNAFYGCSAIFYATQGTDGLLSVWNYGVNPYKTGTTEKLLRPSVSATGSTQATVTYRIDNIYPELDYDIAGDPLGENTYLIKGLRPACEQSIELTVYSANNSFKTTTNATTLPISPKVVSKNITASSLSVEGSYIKGDAKVISTMLTMDGREMTNNEGYLYGLNPSTVYNCKYTMVVEYGDGDTYPYEVSYNIRTASLTMTTQQPKVISAGNVVVSAQSNLDDEETNVGFEWRRIDWTDDFASNTGVAYLYEGTMEGYIRNLYVEKLWKYRPYYQSDSGNRYYGDWVGIDPTNTSYFEPTVHTYAYINVTGNRAEVKGYAMRGTDRVTSQGFMCWKSSSYSLRKKAPSIPSDAVTVEASGNVMTAVFENLDYETQYCYVAFVKTEENETFFGEVQTFSTNVDPDGIKDIEHSPLNIEETWYSLDGKKLSKPQKGINILRYSDGTTRKVLVK